MISRYYNTSKTYRLAVNAFSEVVTIGIVTLVCWLAAFLMGKCYSQTDPLVSFAWLVLAFPVTVYAIMTVCYNVSRYRKFFKNKK